MESRGAKSVPIKGLPDKRYITLTFVVTFSGKFLLMQIIYDGKMVASHPWGVIFQLVFACRRTQSIGEARFNETLKFVLMKSSTH